MARAMPILKWPEHRRTPSTQFDESFLSASIYGKIAGVPIDPVEVAEALAEARIAAVLTGSFVASAWAGRQQGSAPAVVLVNDATLAARALMLKWSDLRPGASLGKKARRVHL